jgi:group II intron reverse transcriptase/maturase
VSEPAGAPSPIASAAVLTEIPARVLAAQLPWPEAWERVRAKAWMPGVDGLSVGGFARTTPASIRVLEHRVASGEYRPLPLRLAEMEKKHGGRRLLLIPAVRDRIVQTAVARWLGPRLNERFDRASFAYRPGLGVHAALRYLRRLRDGGYRWVLDADIRACFDSIEHGRLFDRLAATVGRTSPLLDWLRAWIAAPVWDGTDMWRLARGIPQGSPLSPLLANLFLDAFDRRLREAGLRFVRYADDFLVLTRTPFDLAPARRLVVEGLAALGLELNDDKTRLAAFDEWFRFLGAEIRGEVILLPFEKKTTPLRPRFVAPPMPPALLRAWRAGHLDSSRPLVWPPPADRTRSPGPRTDRHTATLARLGGAGAVQGLRRRPIHVTSKRHEPDEDVSC